VKEAKTLLIFAGLALVLASTNIAVSEPFDSSIISKWHFDEAGGAIAYDDMGNHNGIISGATWSEGISGSALNFDGRDDYLEISDISSQYNTFSLSLWVNFTQVNKEQPFISRQNGIGIGRTILGLRNCGGISSYLGKKTIKTYFRPEEGLWHHYVLTYDNGTLKIYIDGVLKITKSVFEEGATGSFIFGSDKVFRKFFKGILDEVTLYNKALSSEEVLSLYEELKTSDVNNGVWHFEEGEGLVSYDSLSSLEANLNGAYWETEGVAGGALDFDGIDDSAQISGLTITDDTFSVAFWASFDDVLKKQVLISRKDGSGRGQGRNILVLRKNGGIGSYLGKKVIKTYFKPGIDEWHHYAVTYDQGMVRIYIDGALIKREEVKEELATGAFVLGADKRLRRFFDGKLDELVIANKVLIPEEISNLYEGLWASLNIEPVEKIVDFDGDGVSDILWRNIDSGAVYLWLKGANLEDESLVTSAFNQDVRSISDLNGDGKDDIILKDIGTDDISIWLMDGINVLDHGSVDDLIAYGYTLEQSKIDNFAWNKEYTVLLKDEQDYIIRPWIEAGKMPVIPLTLAAPGADYMMISEDSSFTGQDWIDFQPEVDFTLSSGDGEKVIYSKFKDSSGKEIAGIPETLLVDMVSPLVNITNPAEGAMVKKRKYALTVEGTVSESCIKVFVNGKEADLDNETNTFSLSLILAKGSNTIQATAIDLNGNFGESEISIEVK